MHHLQKADLAATPRRSQAISFVQEIVCGGEMPDGSLWLLDEEGAQITVGLNGSEVSQSLVMLTVRRKPRQKVSRRRW